MRLDALLAALGELFGPRLSFGSVEDEMLPILWEGVEEDHVWLGGDEEDLAWRVLDAAHTAALEGLGGCREHPGEWATALPEVLREGSDLVLVLEGRAGSPAWVRVPWS